MHRKLQHTNRQLTREERARLAKIRSGAEHDFPPTAARQGAPPGVAATIRAAREARGLTWYALAQRAGIPNQATIRDVEQGKDVKVLNLQAIAEALDLQLELVSVR